MYIGIAGNIGSGKTSLARVLGNEFNWTLSLESVEDNPYLTKFYEDMDKWSYPLQMHFLNSRFEQYQHFIKRSEVFIQDRTIYEDCEVFAKNLFDAGIMSKEDFGRYYMNYKAILQEVKAPDLLIYLKADISKLVSNIEKRGRTYEQGMSEDYLMQLQERYTQWIESYSAGKCLSIDVNQLDYVNSEKDAEDVISLVKTASQELFQ